MFFLLPALLLVAFSPSVRAQAPPEPVLYAGVSSRADGYLDEAHTLHQALPVLLGEAEWQLGQIQRRRLQAYLQACPAASVDGALGTCEWVVGRRASAAFVVGGSYEARGELDDGSVHLYLRFVDVAAIEVLEIEFPPTTEPSEAAAVLVAAAERHLAAPAPVDIRVPQPDPAEEAVRARLASEGAPGVTEVEGIEQGLVWRTSNRRVDLAFKDVDPEELLLAAEQLNMPPQDYLAYRASGLQREQYLRMWSGRRHRVEAQVDVRLLAGSVAPVYGVSIRLDESGDPEPASAAYGLDTGIAGEVSMAGAVGLSRRLALHLALGAQFGPGVGWYEGVSSTSSGRYQADGPVERLVRPTARLGVQATTRPQMHVHGAFGLHLLGTWLPRVKTVPSGFPESDSGFLPGIACSAGLAWEGARGFEVRPTLEAGTYLWSRVQQTGDDWGPATWPAPLPLHAALSVSVGGTRRRASAPDLLTPQPEFVE